MDRPFLFCLILDGRTRGLDMEQEAKQSELDDIVVIDKTIKHESKIVDVSRISDDDEVDASTTTTHRLKAEPDNRARTSSPGKLKTKGSVVIHTRSAHELFYGRRGDRESGVNQIVGLTLFATNANNLSLLCKRDDPYAEAALIKNENLFDDIQKDLSKKITHHRFGGATRDDIAANNAVARAVIEKYGVLPPQILEKELLARFVSHDRT